VIETLIVIVATIISLSIGLFVLTRNPKQLLNRVYAVTTLAFVVIIVANSLTIGDTTTPYLTLLFIRIVIAATSIALVGLYFLVALIRDNRPGILREPKHRVALLATFIVVALELSPAVFSDISVQDGQPIPVPSFGVPFFLIHALFFLIASLAILFRGLRKAQRLKRFQYISIIIGLTPILLFAPVTSFIFPIVFQQTGFIYLTPLYAAFFVAMVAYAMVRHGLFDIKQAAIRTFTYILTLLTLSAIYYALAFVISNIILRSSAESAFAASPINIILALALAFIFQPIKRLFDRITNFIFFRDSYDTSEFFARLTQKISVITDLYSLLHYATSEISRTLKAEFGAFSIHETGKRPIFVSTDKRKNLPAEDIRELDEYIVAHDGNIVITDTLMTAEQKSIERILTSHRIALVLPIFQEEAIKGYLFLGEHRSSRYAIRDVQALETIADELVIAIRNALSLHEVKNLNATLQQRIDEATKELRASNAQLQRLDEAKDEFISMASHQLRTPLTSIKGYISMLVEGDVGKVTPDQKHLLDEAFISSERMVRLIGDFLNVSRLQTGKFIIEKQPVDLAKIVAQEIESLLPNASARKLKFTYKQPKNFPALNLDESKIRQVIMNFADNAIYYSKEKSTIKIELKTVGKTVEFTVKDTGIGVPDKEKDNLFGKFFRATNARKQRPDGTGVGLFLAKKVIDAHDGQVIFESKEGKGSTFGFRLPVVKLVARDSKQLDDKPGDTNHNSGSN
jgi:signal transduction histidine kinase